MEQFTANEVREHAELMRTSIHNLDPHTPVMLHAYADHLEAEEKAVPVMVVNHVSSAEHDLPIGMKLYTHPSLHKGATHCDNCGCTWLDDGNNPIGCPYCKPSSADADQKVTQKCLAPPCIGNGVCAFEYRKVVTGAEMLAEALRNLVSEWVAIADDGDATLEDSTIGYRACANRLSAMLAAHSAQAQPPAASVTVDAVMRVIDGQRRLPYCSIDEKQAFRNELEAALAAQENPNG